MMLHRRALAGVALLPAFAGAARAQGSETTFDRVNRTKILRIAALPGELPYFAKDLASGEWKGACIDFARDIAKVFDAKLEYIESTYGGSVLDLQSNKIDLAFALGPTPQRALSIAFTRPFLNHPYGCMARAGLEARSWADLNKPEVRVACDLGSINETAARRYAPKSTITALKTRDDVTLAFQSGRADAMITAALLGLSIQARNKALGPFHMLTNPTVALPSCFGVRRDGDARFIDVINAWIDYNRATGQIREWLIGGLGISGVTADDIPADVTF